MVLTAYHVVEDAITGKDGTKISSHLAGTEIKSITQQDNALIELGDDFGFSGTTL